MRLDLHPLIIRTSAFWYLAHAGDNAGLLVQPHFAPVAGAVFQHNMSSSGRATKRPRRTRLQLEADKPGQQRLNFPPRALSVP